MILGTLNILGHFTKILIDPNVIHSVISPLFSQMIQPQGTPIRYVCESLCYEAKSVASNGSTEDARPH